MSKKDKTISIPELRNLTEIVRNAGRMLTKEEYTNIICVFRGCLERNEKERGE